MTEDQKSPTPAAGPARITPEALLQLGAASIVYVRPVRASDLVGQVEGVEELAEGTMLYAVHAANGVPMALLPDKEAAFAAARSHEMVPLSVH